MQVGETAVYMVGVSADSANELINFIGYQLDRGNYVPTVLKDLADFLLKEIYGEAYEAAMSEKEGVHYGLPEGT